MKPIRAAFSLLSLIFFLFIEDINSECPNVITRRQWGAKPNKDVEYMLIPVKYAIIEHTATPECNSFSTCNSRVGNIQSYHMDELQYHDIGYNFLIGGDGNVYEGTGWHKVGAHTYRWNSKAIGIVFIGDFSDKLPPQAALDAAKKLLECGVELLELDSRYKLVGHRQIISTASPGARLYQEITSWPHFVENP